LRHAAAILAILLAALFFPSIFGGADEVQEASSTGLLEWPMLPGDSLTQLARLIYPHDRAMQLHFIDAAKRENPEVFARHGSNQRFDQETLIRMPDLRQLSRFAARSRTAHSARHPAGTHNPSQAGNAVHPALQVSTALEQHAALPGRVQRSPDEVRVARGREDVAVPMAVTSQVEELMARNLALKREQAALDARLAALEANALQVQQAIANYRARPAKISKSRPKAPAALQSPHPAGDSLLPVSPMHLLTLGAVVLAGGGLVWLRRRYQRKSAAGAPASPLTSPPTLTTKPGVAPRSIQSLASHHDDSAFSVNEISSVVDEAKVFIALGRDAQAVEMLEEYIAAHPRAPVNPWLYLLEIHRGAKRKEEFTALARRFHQTFNVMAPQWENSSKTQMMVPRSLEEFPHIVKRLTEGWGTLDAQDFLNHLLEDNRGGERQGFSMDVLHEILLMLAILEVRDYLPALEPF
jgi:Tfp pilus assembly protein FimV